MAKALVVTLRDTRLPPVLQALAGTELSCEPVRAVDAACRRLTDQRFDLLVVDFASMQRADQRAVAPLRSAAGAVPLLAVVAAAAPAAFRHAVELPSDAILVDPIDLDVAAATLQRLLRARAATVRESDPLEGLSTFLKGLAHEILNPLTPITAFLQILQRDPALAPEVKARYEMMAEGTRRIEKTVRDLECFARVRKPQRALFDLAAFLREQVERWRSADPPFGSTLHAPTKAPLVLADREQLAVAFRQLAGFAAGGGNAGVEIELRPERDALDIAIRGHAPVRLPPRSADALLPYHDIQGSGRPGTLDLAAAWGILRSHHASLTVEPQSDSAVRFAVRFPTASISSDAEDDLP